MDHTLTNFASFSPANEEMLRRGAEPANNL